MSDVTCTYLIIVLALKIHFTFAVFVFFAGGCNEMKKYYEFQCKWENNMNVFA